MKNKSRCKHLKKIFACCALVFLLISISAPCFATGVYPTQSNTFTGRRTFIPSDGWSYDNCVAMADIIEKAYRLNYFSAGVPVAVISFMEDYVGVLVVSSVATYTHATPIPGATYQGYQPALPGDSRSGVYCSVEEYSSPFYVTLTARDSVSNRGYAMTLYYLNGDNTFCNSGSIPSLHDYDEQNPSDSIFTAGFGTISSYFGAKSDIIALRFGDNDWRVPYADTYSDIDPIIIDLDEWYDDRITPSVVDVDNNFSYELDIPSIITAIPNGAKQIINNVFGFELFGINVAGLLSVLLIVAIVSFIVKKLMK